MNKEQFWEAIREPTAKSCSNCMHKNPDFPGGSGFTCSLMGEIFSSRVRTWECDGGWNAEDCEEVTFMSRETRARWLKMWEWDEENE